MLECILLFCETVDGSAKTSVLNVVGTSMKGTDSTSNGLLQEVSFSIPFAWKE